MKVAKVDRSAHSWSFKSVLLIQLIFYAKISNFLKKDFAPPEKKNRCHMTPLHPHNGYHSTTTTIFCPLLEPNILIRKTLC